MCLCETPDAPDLDLTSDWTIELWFKDLSPEGYFHAPRVLLTKGDPLVDRQVPYGLLVAFVPGWRGLFGIR